MGRCHFCISDNAAAVNNESGRHGQDPGIISKESRMYRQKTHPHVLAVISLMQCLSATELIKTKSGIFEENKRGCHALQNFYFIYVIDILFETNILFGYRMSFPYRNSCFVNCAQITGNKRMPPLERFTVRKQAIGT
jgi:hypothetical protein